MRLRLLAAIVLVFSPFWITQADAGENSPDSRALLSEKEQSTAEYSKAPLVLDGKIIFFVRGISAYPAGERAAQISQRLVSLAKDITVPAASIQLVPGKDYVRIEAGDHFLMNVYDLDIEGHVSVRNSYAEILKTDLADAVTTYRDARKPWNLARKSAQATGSLLILALLFWGLARLARILEKFYAGRLQRTLETIQSKSFDLIHAKRIETVVSGFIQFSRVLIAVVLGLFTLQYILGLFPWTAGIARHLLTFLLTPIRAVGAAFIASLPDFVFLGILGAVVYYVLKLVQLFFAGIAHKTIRLKDFDPDWAWPTQRIVSMLIIVFAVVVAYPYIPGSNSAAFKGISLFLGVLFSLGSSSFVANIIAGYSVIYRRAFKVGDRVKIDDVIGEVEEIDMMVTRLRTIKNEEIVLPNSNVINNRVVNYSHHARDGRLILYTTVGIGYETPWRQVEAMLCQAAQRTEGALKTPAPFVYVKSLGDFAAVYELNVYCDTPSRIVQIYSNLHKNVLDLFNEYGVQIMTPAYVGDPEQPKVVPKDQWYTAPARNIPTNSEPSTTKVQ